MQCIWTSALAEERNVTPDSYKDLFLICEQNGERNFSDNTSINRFVISEAIVRCLKMIHENWTKDSKLYSINTDDFFLWPIFKTHIETKRMSILKSNILASHLKQTRHPHILKNIIERIWLLVTFWIYEGDSCIYYGQAGCGKTTKVVKLALTAKDPIILSFTSKAIENAKSRFQKYYKEKGRQYQYRGFNLCFSIYSESEDDEEKHKNYNDELDMKCFTFDSYFCEYNRRDITSLNGKTIFIEEYSMVPNK